MKILSNNRGPVVVSVIAAFIVIVGLHHLTQTQRVDESVVQTAVEAGSCGIDVDVTDLVGTWRETEWLAEANAMIVGYTAYRTNGTHKGQGVMVFVDGSTLPFSASGTWSLDGDVMTTQIDACTLMPSVTEGMTWQSQILAVSSNAVTYLDLDDNVVTTNHLVTVDNSVIPESDENHAQAWDSHMDAAELLLTSE